MTRLLGLLLWLLPVTLLSQPAEFQFRSEDRPVFSNSIRVDALKTALVEGKTVVLDVRLAEDFAETPAMIPGAIRMNPETLPDWISSLNKEQDIIVYCVAGKWVSQKVAYLLDQAGFRVQSLEGGIEAWQGSLAQ